jgi:hypothetical protein
MKDVRRLFGVAVIAIAATGMAACGGGGGGGSAAPAPVPAPPPPAPPPPAASGTLNGLVFSAATGAAISATVDGAAPATTTVTGSFQLSAVPAAERVVVRVSASGYVDTLAVAAVRQGAVTLARVTLLPVGTTSTVNPQVR